MAYNEQQEVQDQTSEPAMTDVSDNQTMDVLLQIIHIPGAASEDMAVEAGNETTTSTYRVIIIDLMALVISMFKTD